MSLPRIHVISLGGTIAMSSRATAGVVPALNAADLVAAVPQLSQIADLEAGSFRLLPGAHLKIEDVVALSHEIARRVSGGTDGVVITQGTDTIEEVAFGLDLLADTDAPVVVTGAMRNPTLPGADGPSNLLAAVLVAASDAARGLGTLVVMNDEIHAARYVRKSHTASPGAFRSPLTGPIGWVSEGKVRIAARPERKQNVPVPEGAAVPPVALITASLGDDGRLLAAVEQLGYSGLVVEALGGGHVPAEMVERLGHIATSMPVVYASRVGIGEVLRQTYGFPGSETDLQQKGLIPSGILDGPKARMLLSLLLAAGESREAIEDRFKHWLEA